jgi:hypothetical protein
VQDVSWSLSVDEAQPWHPKPLVVLELFAGLDEGRIGRSVCGLFLFVLHEKVENPYHEAEEDGQDKPPLLGGTPDESNGREYNPEREFQNIFQGHDELLKKNKTHSTTRNKKRKPKDNIVQGPYFRER